MAKTRNRYSAAEHLKRLRIPKTPAQMWPQLRREFGREYVSQLQDALAEAEAATAAGADSEEALIDVYSVMWRDAETALATHAFSSYVTRAWLRWAEKEDPVSGAARLLDVGCGAGIITAWHALASPATEVIGVDRSAQAVAVATEIADRLGAENARFAVAAFEDGFAGVGRDFDAVISVTAVHGHIWQGPTRCES